MLFCVFMIRYGDMYFMSSIEIIVEMIPKLMRAQLLLIDVRNGHFRG